jgi:hypothetical protein
LRTSGGGICGESRASGLWGGSRGGQGSNGGRGRRAVVAVLLLALAAPLVASAGDKHAAGNSYLAPALTQTAQATPDREVPVIVMSDDSASRAQKALGDFADSTTKLPIVDGAAADVRAGDLPELASENSGLAIVPDEPVALDGLGGGKHVGNAPYSSHGSLAPGSRGRQAVADPAGPEAR